MKRPKKPTRAQKEMISDNYLNASKWLVIHESDFFLKIVNKDSGKMKTITKFGNKKVLAGTSRQAHR